MAFFDVGDQAITNVTLTPNAPDGIFVYPRSVSIPRIAGRIFFNASICSFHCS